MIKLVLKLSVAIAALIAASQAAPAFDGQLMPLTLGSSSGLTPLSPSTGQQLFYGTDRTGNTIIANQRGEIVGAVSPSSGIGGGFGGGFGGGVGYGYRGDSYRGDGYRGDRYRGDRYWYDDDDEGNTLGRLFRLGRSRRGGRRRGDRCKDDNDNIFSTWVEVLCEMTDGLFSD